MERSEAIAWKSESVRDSFPVLVSVSTSPFEATGLWKDKSQEAPEVEAEAEAEADNENCEPLTRAGPGGWAKQCEMVK